MKIRVIGSTCKSKGEAIKFCGRAAGICYMPHSFNELEHEKESKTLARARGTLTSGHHSVYDHAVYNLLFEGIPKILAMFLNNEKMYTTSEKSARYTKMESGGEDFALYQKWKEKLEETIKAEHSKKFLKFYESEKRVAKVIEKLAMENARYMLSVFTPTMMLYTASLRQINYLIRCMEKFIEERNKTAFERAIAEAMKDFLSEVPEEIVIEGLNADSKGKEFSLLVEEDKSEDYFGYVYSMHYKGSLAQIAQAQRHRTLGYEISELSDFEAYVPPILVREDVEEWKRDMESVSKLYPQGSMVSIHEFGSYDKFLLKCYERICGCAQLEIEMQSRATLERYHEEVPNLVTSEYLRGARCTFPHFKCSNPCVWGAKGVLNRNI